MPAPRVIYRPKAGSPIDVDREFYGRLGRDTESRSLVEQFVVPIRSGKAWPVMAGQLCRIVVVEGAQVADFNAWNLKQSPGTVLGGPHQAAAPGPRHHVRPAVVMSPVPASDAYHYRRHRGLSPGRGRGGMSRPAGHPLRSIRSQAAERRGLRLQLPLELGAGNHSVPSRRERRPRRAQHIPSDRTYAGTTVTS